MPDDGSGLHIGGSSLSNDSAVHGRVWTCYHEVIHDQARGRQRV